MDARAPENGWHYEYITPDLLQGERVERIVHSGRTAFQSVVIQDTACFGRSLVLDDKTQSTEVDEFVYHESLVQPSMIAHPGPRRVFIAGGGEGATAREALRHRTVERVVMADIDEQVVDLCRRHLGAFHQGSFDDPRLELHHRDAMAVLDESQGAFDVAVIDVPDPLEGGPAYLLFTAEFYALARARLAPGGLLVAQAGPTGPAFHEQCFSAVANTVGSAFPTMSAYEAFVPSFGATWGFVVGSLEGNPAALDATEVDARLDGRGISGLRHYDGETHTGMFSLPKYLRAAIRAEHRVITKDEPLFVT